MTKLKSKPKTKRNPLSKNAKGTSQPIEQSLKKLSKQVQTLEKVVADLKQKQAAQKLAAKKEKTRAQVKRRTQRKKVKKLKESLI